MARRRLAAFMAALSSLLATSLFMSHPAIARATVAQIGVPSCDAEPSAGTGHPVGSTVRVFACFSSDAGPAAGQRAMFVIHGRSPIEAIPATTDQQGQATAELSSESHGVFVVAACTADVCTPSLKLRWGQGAEPAVLAPEVAAGSSEPKAIEPQVDALGAPGPSGSGFGCLDADATAVPSFIAIEDSAPEQLPHPRTGSQTAAWRITTESAFLPGSVIYRRPALAFLMVDDPAVEHEASGSFPLNGADRILAFWSYGDARIGKSELAFDGSRWVDVSPSFTAVARGNDIYFFPDEEPVIGDVKAGTRVAGLCDSTARVAAASPEEAIPRSMAIAVGVLILAMMLALAVAILRSSEPPSNGIVIDRPAGPVVGFERSDVTFDVMGRPLGFSDILAMPDGSIHTIKARIAQQSLVIEAPEVLDPSDWEDEVLNVRRSGFSTDASGKISGFRETIFSDDGLEQGSSVRSVEYDRSNRVVRFERVLEGPGPDGPASVEVVELVHDGPTQAEVVIPDLAAGERVHRAEMRYDADGHIVGAVCTSVTDGSGELTARLGAPAVDAAVPQPMWMAGRVFPAVPITVSSPNRGVTRMRHVLTRWFRTHGCKIEVVITDPLGNPLADLPLRIGAHLSHTDHRGHQRFWALTKGNYAVSTVEGFISPSTGSNGHEPEGRWVDAALIGWIVVEHIPGWVDARFAAAVSPSESSVIDQP